MSAKREMNAGLRGRTTTALPVLVLLLAWGGAYGRDEQFRLNLELGYRWSSAISGSRDLYRSQVNLGEGPKLLAGDFFWASPPGSNSWADRLDFRMSSWGGEPYNLATLRAVKSRSYDLRFSYLNSHYFDSIPYFANPLLGLGSVESQHRSDISQRAFRIELSLIPGRTIVPFIAYERSSRRGPVDTTLAGDGDEFALHSDVRGSSDDVRFGARLNRDSFSLLLEQGFRWFRDQTAFDASGFQPGNSPRTLLGRDITLTAYSARNGFRAVIPFSTVILRSDPVHSISMRGRFSYSDAAMDSYLPENTTGTFVSAPLAIFYRGALQSITGKSKQPAVSGDFSLEWRAHERLAFLDRINVRQFHVSGAAAAHSLLLQVEPLLEPELGATIELVEPFSTFLSGDLNSHELQAVFYLTPRTVVRGGHRLEHKEVRLPRRYAWDRQVLLAGFGGSFSSHGRFSLDYERGWTNRPILRLDALESHRLRLSGNVNPVASIEFGGNAGWLNQNDDRSSIDWVWRSRNLDGHVTYSPSGRFSLSLEYGWASTRSELLFLIPQVLLPDRSHYRESTRNAALFLNVKLPRQGLLGLGYSILGSVGTFPYNSHRPLARIEVPVHPRVTAFGQWNYFDWNEKMRLFPQDYRAHLVLFGFRFNVEGK